MASGSNGVVLREVRRLFQDGTVAGLGESQLLERFLSRRDESAFTALVARHGPMVLGVCRRWLRDEHEVEDAFQATFLVFVRKAATIRDRDLLGPWLFGVAMRTAARARARGLRRKSLGIETVDPIAESAVGSSDAELGPILDEELDRLPEKYRRPIVLCYLEGLTHDEAARRLDWPVGTVRGRLARARQRLRDRLVRRGLAPSVLMVGGGLTSKARAAVPLVLQEQTVRAALSYAAGPAIAAGMVSATAMALSGGVIRAMFLTKLKLAAIATMAGIVATGAAVRATQEPGPSADVAPGPPPAIAPAPAAEPLPPAPGRPPAPARPADLASVPSAAAPEQPPAPPAPPAPGHPQALVAPGIADTPQAPEALDTIQRPVVSRRVDRSEHARQSLERTRREVEEAIVGLTQEIKELTVRLNRAQVELRRLERVRKALVSAGEDENHTTVEALGPPTVVADQGIPVLSDVPTPILPPTSKPTQAPAPPAPATSNSDQRLREVEQKLDRLMRTLDELRGQKVDSGNALPR